MNTLNFNWPKPKNINALTTLKSCDINNLDLLNNKKYTVFFINQQEHGINILPANTENSIPIADGSYTQQKNLICAVKTADCLPVFITNKQGNFVAILHCGWRGLAKGIIANFFKQINHLNLNCQDLLFLLGPAIGPDVFEVGEDVLEQFKLNNFDLYNTAFKKINNINNKYLVNIYQIAQIGLKQFNINNNQIFSDNWCTFSQSELFHSYRREQQSPNRMLNLIWIS